MKCIGATGLSYDIGWLGMRAVCIRYQLRTLINDRQGCTRSIFTPLTDVTASRAKVRDGGVRRAGGMRGGVTFWLGSGDKEEGDGGRLNSEELLSATENLLA